MDVDISEAPQVPKRRLPLVFISFNIVDSTFRDKLSLLLTREPISSLISVSDWPIENGKELSPLFQAAVERADVAVLLISPEYLKSQASSAEGLEFVKQREHRGLRLLPILLRPCSWREVTWLSETQVFPLDGVPISAYVGEEQEYLWAQAASHIMGLATIICL